MGRITVKFAGRPFCDWTGTADQIAAMAAPLSKIAEMAHATLDQITASAVLTMTRHGEALPPGALIGRNSGRAAVLYFIANQATHHPDYPGRYCDYLGTWSFAFDIRLDEAGAALVIAVDGATGGVKRAWPRLH